ncbi:hypothetical protein SDC9_90440 [bioreactor metagenome]|uniref:Uncharacterized protein n=1 Tax=bioreactor metagenome TaxID=1076179 RepID=A0A644ZYR4_9ZZZZ
MPQGIQGQPVHGSGGGVPQRQRRQAVTGFVNRQAQQNGHRPQHRVQRGGKVKLPKQRLNIMQQSNLLV